MAKAGLTTGQSHDGDHRRPECQKREEGWYPIDPDGCDAPNKIERKKRRFLVDIQGLMSHAIVHAACIQDRDSGAWLLGMLFRLCLMDRRTFDRGSGVRPLTPR
jgi:hypothetical protein